MHLWPLHSCCYLGSWGHSHRCPSGSTMSSWPGRNLYHQEYHSQQLAPGDQDHQAYYLKEKYVDTTIKFCFKLIAQSWKQEQSSQLWQLGSPNRVFFFSIFICLLFSWPLLSISMEPCFDYIGSPYRFFFFYNVIHLFTVSWPSSISMEPCFLPYFYIRFFFPCFLFILPFWWG